MNAWRRLVCAVVLTLAAWRGSAGVIQAGEEAGNPGDNYTCTPGTLTPLHELLGKYRDRPFEIKAIFPNKKRYQGVSDTWLTSEAYGQGLSRVLKTGSYAFDHNALLRFDLAALPKDAKIEAALLKLRSFAGRGGQDKALYRLLRVWGAGKGFNGQVREGLAVESHDAGGLQPKTGESSWWYSTRPDKWGAPGAAKPGVDRSEQPLASGRLVPDASPSPAKDEFRTWVAWDVTAAAQAWVQNPESNFGVVVDGQSGGGFCEFLSSEAYDPFGRPKLVVLYRLEK